MSVSVVRLNICSNEASLAQVIKGDKIKVDLSTLNDQLKLQLENTIKRKTFRLTNDQVLSLYRTIKDGAASAGYFIPATWCHSIDEVEAQDFPIDTAELTKAWKANNKRSSEVVPKFIKAITDEKVSY